MDGEPGDGDIGSNPEETDAAGCSSALGQQQTDDLGMVCTHTVCMTVAPQTDVELIVGV